MATKPTIDQYDDVYRGLRPGAQELYVLLRTWILEGGAGTMPVVSTTYNDLLTLLNSSNAVPGQMYLITDFATRQEIPNTAVTNQAPPEPLAVVAVSSSQLSPNAVSTLFDEDQIVYDINNGDFGADKGRIMYRKNPRLNLESWFDWRRCLFRRWETSLGSGVFTVITDNGNAFVDSQAFQIVGLPTSSNCSIKPFKIPFGVTRQNNIVLGPSCRNVSIDDSCLDLTLLQSCIAVNIGKNNNNITLFDGCGSIEIGNTNSQISIEGNCQGITIGSNNQNITYESGAINCTMHDGIMDRTISGVARNRFDWRDLTRYNLTYDFDASGGTVGVYILGRISENAQGVYTLVRAINPLTGVSEPTLAVGFSVDDFEALQPLLGISAPDWNGDTNNGANLFISTTFSVVTTTDQDIILTVSNQEITGGKIYVRAEVIYTDF